MGGQFCYSSDPPLASGLWPLAARWPLSECKSRRCWSGVCQSDSGYVMSFRAKHFDSPCLCHLLQFLLLQLLSLANLFWKITATVSPPDRDLSEQHRPQWARARQDLLFTDGDYVIISIRAKKNVTLSLSRMFGGSGSQSWHILTASIWLSTVVDTCLDKQVDTGGNRLEKKTCAPSHFFWFSGRLCCGDSAECLCETGN